MNKSKDVDKYLVANDKTVQGQNIAQKQRIIQRFHNIVSYILPTNAKLVTTMREPQNAEKHQVENTTPIEQQNLGSGNTNVNVNVSVNHHQDGSISSSSSKHSHDGESEYSNTPQSSKNLENSKGHEDTKDAFESTITERLPKTPNPTLLQRSNLKHLFSGKKISIPFILISSLLIILSGLLGEYDGRWRLLLSANTMSTVTPVPDPICLHTFVVTTTQDKGHGSFREMVNKAQDGDCITFTSSIKDTISLTNELDIKHSITIQGNSPLSQQIKSLNKIQDDNHATPTIINDNSSYTNFSIFPNIKVTFIGLSFRGSDTYLNNSLISNHSQDLNIISCSFHSFHSHYTGSIISNLQGNVTLKDSYLTDNHSQSDGGGAIYNLNGTLTLDHSTVTSNYADSGGGGIYNVLGSVYLKRHSSLNTNHIELNDQAGGGGILSQGGTVVISDSEIQSNSTSGDGGGILLRGGASAQIISSQIHFNSEPSGKDIAVEADPTTGQPSYLFMDPAPSLNDVLGQVNQGDPRMTSSLPLANLPTTNDPTKNPDNHFLGNLTAEKFRTYCHQLNSSFTDVVIGIDKKSIQCTSSDNTLSKSFSDLNIAMKDVCKTVFPTDANERYILARLASYWNPASWQCFKDEQKEKDSITKDFAQNPVFPGETKLDMYCKIEHGTRAFLLPLPQDQQTGYQWKCTDDGSNPWPIGMTKACQDAYGDDAIDFLDTYTDPYSWYCWVPIPTDQIAIATPTLIPTP